MYVLMFVWGVGSVILWLILIWGFRTPRSGTVEFLAIVPGGILAILNTIFVIIYTIDYIVHHVKII